jgi:phosphatidylglycerol lysyltransferase
VAVGATVWLFIFVHRHTASAPALWSQVDLRATGPRAVRTIGAVVFATLVAGAWMVRRSTMREPPPPNAVTIARAERAVAASPRATAALAFVGDKRVLFGDGDRAFVMYGVHGRSWIALGDPVGSEELVAELTWRFRELTDRHDAECAFHAVEEARLPLYLDLGLTLTRVGDEGRIALGADAETPSHEPAHEGSIVHVVDPAELPSRLDALRTVDEAWRGTGHHRELGFVAGPFKPEWIRRFPAVLVERDGALIAFASVLPSGRRAEIAVDLVRHTPAAPPHVGELVFDEAMRWGRARGYARLNVGMAPTGDPEERSPVPGWNRLRPLLYPHAALFGDDRALRAFAESRGAVWTPRYLAAPGGMALLRVLADLTALIGGDPGVASWRYQPSSTTRAAL